MKNLNEECMGFVNKTGHVYHYVSLDAAIKAREGAKEASPDGDVGMLEIEEGGNTKC